jgi:hypothetical protein
VSAVETLLRAYCAEIDRREEPKKAAAHFTTDGALDNSAIRAPVVTGREALVETIGGMFNSMAILRHDLSNFAVSGDEGRCDVDAQATPKGGDAFSMRGTYSFEARQEDGALKIARLTFHPA